VTFKANPQEIQKYVEQQSDPKVLAEVQKAQIRKARVEAEEQVKNKYLRNS
jgi:hypothetical protein